MPKIILDIYKDYKIPPSLQEHMFRVAAVASLICDNFNESLDKEEIVAACLLHDMGNIIKFKMNVIPEFFEPEGVEYWQKVKDEYIEKYGKDEHKATIRIMKEIGVSHSVVEIVDRIDFDLYYKTRDSDDFNYKISIYSDARVNPYGVVSYEDRMEEGRKRYQNHKSTFGAMEELERIKLVECGKEIEKQIFSKCKIKPEDITDESVAQIIEQLRDFVVK